MKTLTVWVCSWLALGILMGSAEQPSGFRNFETAPVHPVALSPDGSTLAVCNLPDGRVDLFAVGSGLPVSIGDVPVGVDPVSARFRTTNELWVVNHISASVNIVDLAKRRVVATLDTLAGPADVVFASSARAFVSCAKENTVQVFDAVTRQVVTNLVVDGERPKAMAISPDGTKVYVAIFESGNASTVLTGDALRHPDGPYRGQFPPPNDGLNLNPPLYLNPEVNPVLYTNGMPKSLIVKKNSAGRWMDDNQGDWTEFISGTNSSLPYRLGIYGRPRGWDMPDRDLAIIDATTFAISYATSLMNICMDVAVNPASGTIAVIGTDAINERRFEPNLRGTFLRVNLALVDPLTRSKTIVDLNRHLDYSTPSVPSAIRDLSVGDPRGIVWNAAGTRAYVTGMGSRNLIVLGANGERVNSQPVELGEGPCGLALDETRGRLYLLNRFSATLTALDTAALTILTNVPLFDPTPLAIKLGRKHLYDTRKNSGLGYVACASCHVDARFDRLAWDLGNPSADTLNAANTDTIKFHPMKGPLVTQTLQDVIRAPQLHWRGDRQGIEDFNITFTALLAANAPLTTNEMQQLKDFLDTIHFPPNRFRNFDNSLPTDLPLPGTIGMPDASTGPLPNGNAQRGRLLFQSCAPCHQSGAGLNVQTDDNLATRDGLQFKIAQLRSIPDKLGMDLSGTTSRAGFGFRFDGRDDSLSRFFLDVEVFSPTNNQSLADLIAFLLAFTGGERPVFDFFGTKTPSQDAPASLGRQLTLTSPAANAMLASMLSLADSPTNRLDLIACGRQDDVRRSWFYDRDTGLFQSDRNQEEIAPTALRSLAGPQSELTFTLVARGTGRRISIDRDDDRYFDLTERDLGTDPLDAASHGGNAPPQLGPLPSLAVHPGMTISTNLVAVDADAPGQTLTFSFGGSPPAGATLDPGTGLFTWTPAEDQADQTYSVRIRVTDNGIPFLHDAATLEVRVVSFRIVSLESFEGGLRVHWHGLGGVRYAIQQKNRLEDIDWTDLTSGFIGGSGEGLWVGVVFSTEPQMFYRIVRSTTGQ